jgi:SAM-dependent methyltransferase
VSAFDFLEHVPRILPTRDGLATRFPFVELMQEIWRVLDDRGRLYALTPAWPSAEAFVDPTHVNILTAASHRYFCGDAPAARMYGFAGRFEPLRIERVERNEALSASADSGPAGKRVTRRLRRWSRWLRGRGERVPAYLLWELEARR